jgi:hypothetical protein
MSSLNDLNQAWGSDLSASPSGDLSTASGDLRTQQRIIRRLMTCPADPVNNLPPDYVWHPTYGAGLPRFIGSDASTDEIVAVVRGQMMLEAAVAQKPAPTVTAQLITNGISLTLGYTDAISGNPQTLSFSATN